MSVDTFADVGDDGQDDTTNEPEPSRYHAVYDGGPGHAPGEEGRTYAGKMLHPPVYCPAPKIMANMRGLYRCPCCGVKVRHSSHVPARERAYENTEEFWESVSDGIAQAWAVAWPSLQAIIILSARAIAWMARAAVNTITRHPRENDDATSTGLVPDRRDTGNENAEINCTTSDGIHVINISDGQVKCLACDIKLPGKVALCTPTETVSAAGMSGNAPSGPGSWPPSRPDEEPERRADRQGGGRPRVILPPRAPVRDRHRQPGHLPVPVRRRPAGRRQHPGRGSTGRRRNAGHPAMSRRTHPICDPCWDQQHPARVPGRLLSRQQERCCWCGQATRSGIYMRADPGQIPGHQDHQ